jgi:hypothetical protein
MWLQIGMDLMLKLLWEFIIQTGFAVLLSRGKTAKIVYRPARLQRLEPDQVYAAYCRILKELLRDRLSLTWG